MMGMSASFYRVSNSMLQTIMSNIDDIDEILYESQEIQDTELDIDKSWHGIYFLLTGDASFETANQSLAGQAILGGDEIGEDQGYGPLRFLPASKVIEIHRELSSISVSELASRFHLEKINKEEIYPSEGNWTEEDRDYLVEHYAELVKFYQIAASNEESILLLMH
ncbi:YfbM family protein [Gottfriedia solisilvae]|uniref:YfbM family protein n=1 Tax=Gottfriedia solisilvae TaxID=1516104 RepID=UPI003D2EAAF8